MRRAHLALALALGALAGCDDPVPPPFEESGSEGFTFAYVASATVSDLNDDGADDIVISRLGSRGPSVFLNLGGHLAPPSQALLPPDDECTPIHSAVYSVEGRTSLAVASSCGPVMFSAATPGEGTRIVAAPGTFYVEAAPGAPSVPWFATDFGLFVLRAGSLHGERDLAPLPFARGQIDDPLAAFVDSDGGAAAYFQIAGGAIVARVVVGDLEFSRVGQPDHVIGLDRLRAVPGCPGTLLGVARYDSIAGPVDNPVLGVSLNGPISYSVEMESGRVQAIGVAQLDDGSNAAWLIDEQWQLSSWHQLGCGAWLPETGPTALPGAVPRAEPLQDLALLHDPGGLTAILVFPDSLYELRAPAGAATAVIGPIELP